MSNDTSDDPKKEGWPYLFREIKNRTCTPMKDPAFVIYLLIAIIGLGGLGIWAELIKVVLLNSLDQQFDLNSLQTAIVTFFPALIGTSALQLNYAAVDNDDKILLAFGWLGMFSAIIAAILISTLSYISEKDHYFYISIVFAIVAVWFWCFTNGYNPNFKSSTEGAAGGNPLNALKGNTKGFILK